jgi:hypothetical protein
VLMVSSSAMPWSHAKLAMSWALRGHATWDGLLGRHRCAGGWWNMVKCQTFWDGKSCWL